MTTVSTFAALQLFSVFLAHCFGFIGYNVTVLVYSYHSHQLNVQLQRFQLKKKKKKLRQTHVLRAYSWFLHFAYFHIYSIFKECVLFPSVRTFI